MNDFTKKELHLLCDSIAVWMGETNHYPDDLPELLRKTQSMIDNYCDHEWRCWDDEHNTRECMKCNEMRTGEIKSD